MASPALRAGELKSNPKRDTEPKSRDRENRGDSSLRYSETVGGPLQSKVAAYWTLNGSSVQPHYILGLQRSVGNQAVQCLLGRRAERQTGGQAMRVGPGQHPSGRFLAHELTQVVQQLSDKANAPSHTLQRDPDDSHTGSGSRPAAAGPKQRVYIVRDTNLRLGGGTLVHDLEEFKAKVVSTRTEADWTLVISMHGSEERLGAQSPPDWQKQATFYDAAAIEKIFNGDSKFVKWRDKYGPTRLSMVSCRVSASFEKVLIANLTRPGASGERHEGIGLGAGCKPIATAQTLNDAPRTRAAFEKLPPARRDSIVRQLLELNHKWGFYGAPPVPDDQVVHYYYDEDPKGAWVQVEVMVGTGHSVKELKATGIPYWNRSSGPKGAEFRDLCDQGIQLEKRGHTPAVPDVKE